MTLEEILADVASINEKLDVLDGMVVGPGGQDLQPLKDALNTTGEKIDALVIKLTPPVE